MDTVALRNRSVVGVSFRETSELTVSSLDILGKGDAVLRNVGPRAERPGRTHEEVMERGQNVGGANP